MSAPRLDPALLADYNRGVQRAVRANRGAPVIPTPVACTLCPQRFATTHGMGIHRWRVHTEAGRNSGNQR